MCSKNNKKCVHLDLSDNKKKVTKIICHDCNDSSNPFFLNFLIVTGATKKSHSKISQNSEKRRKSVKNVFFEKMMFYRS